MNYESIASYYDRYVKWDTDIPFFLKETAKRSGEILELMSGTGRLSLPLIEAGHKLTCVDSSPEMLNILKEKLEKRGLSAVTVQQDVSKLSLNKRFDTIILPFHSFAELIYASDQVTALNSIYTHLTDKGRFLCSLHNPKIRLKTVSNQLHLIGRYPPDTGKPTLIVWSAESYDPVTRLVDGLQLFEEYNDSGEMVSRIMMEFKFCLLEKAQFEMLAVSAGFKVECLYGDYHYSAFKEESSPVMIFELRR